MLKNHRFFQFLAEWVFFLGLGLGLLGCDRTRSDIAELIAPETPAEALRSVRALIGKGEHQAAIDKAVLLMEKADAGHRGDLAFAAARASALLGATDDALRYLAQAVAELDLDPGVSMNEPAFEPLLTDIRFLQVITAIAEPATGTTKAPTKPSAADTQTKPKADETQIRMDSKGIEVRAGDLVIKLPD